ncbi:MAG: Rieske 2Fe-2S domain-containing protein [Aliifodinibius sp.]|nr:Rieske (2Fe-2S) protein [Fodinibius sp.]NIX02190.1 Rieske 2Fe-2S domain-containing protein [Phycisphaerae bacterium]NIY27760.1 Rieske 2Fe-2S domain-containing protein [Fodinibius sp.]
MTKGSNQSRRQFLVNLGIIGALALAVIGFLRNALAFLFPEGKKKTYHKYLVAKEKEIPIGEAKKTMIGKEPVYVVRLENGYRVYSGVCTHLGCIVRWEPGKNRFYCPCHKGIFDKTGQVKSGPPPRPLDEYRVEVEDKLIFMYVQDKIRSPWT